MARPRKTSTTIKNDPFGDHPYGSVIPPGARWDDAEEQRVDVAQEPTADEAPAFAVRLEPRVPTNPKPAGARPSPAAPPPPPPPPRKRHKLTVHLDDDLVNRVKNAAYWNPRLTIARIAERGIRRAVEEVERENGGRYEQRESELIGGRPIK